MTFLKELVKSMGDEVATSVLVLDNHRAHYGHSVTEYCVSIGLDLLYVPPYASELNPIELVWAHFKRLWGTTVFQRCLNPQLENPDTSQEAIVALVEEVMEDVKRFDFSRLSRGRVRMMLRYAERLRTSAFVDADPDSNESEASAVGRD